MAISSISQLYWKNIKENTRTLDRVASSRHADIFTLAKADVVLGPDNGGITAARYKELLGTEYTA